MRARVLVVAAVACGPAHVQPPSHPDALAARLDTLAARSLAETCIVGATIGVMRGDQIVLVKGYGRADASTVYHIGSLTKQFTAAAVLQLVDAGKLALDEPIGRYVPGFTERVTIRQLLTHTSGIYDFVDADFDRSRSWTRDEVLARFADHPLAFPPGSRWAYSNSNYFLLGLAVEHAAGQPFFDYLHDHVLAPAGLTAIYPCDGRPDEAPGFEVEADAVVPAKRIDPSWPFAEGGLCAAAADMLRWTAALRGGRIVSAASYRAMTTPVVTSDDGAYPYGFGVGLDLVAGHASVGHAGAMLGFASALVDLPADGATAIVLVDTRTEDHVEMRLARRLAADAAGLVRDEPLPTDAASRYAGAYVAPNGVVIDVGVDRDLTMGPADRPPRHMLYQGDDTFHDTELMGIEARFVVEHGRATSIERRAPGEHDIVLRRR